MFDKYDRPDWDTWFMTLAYIIAQKSIDPSTKHGAVAVDEDNTILSVGFNSFPRKCNEDELPLTRPEKYDLIPHAETNLIVNSSRGGISLKGSKIYITGYPCTPCLSLMINAGIKKIIYGKVYSFCVSEASKALSAKLLQNKPLEIIAYENTADILALIGNTTNYIQKKNTT